MSGYNLSRLLVGARGLLGEIKWVTLRTLPLHKKTNISGQIIDGLRIVILPEFITRISKYLQNLKKKYLR